MDNTARYPSEKATQYKACLTSLGMRLAVCKPISGLYRDVTPIQALYKPQPHSRRFELASLSKCCPELLHSWFHRNNGEKLKLTIDVDAPSDRLWITAIVLELHTEDCARDMPKIEFLCS